MPRCQCVNLVDGFLVKCNVEKNLEDVLQTNSVLFNFFEVVYVDPRVKGKNQKNKNGTWKRCKT